MSPQNRPLPRNGLIAPSAYPLRNALCQDRASALDLLQDFAVPDVCNVEAWLDRIEARNGREVRP